ncbi:MAG: hypothetical protein NUV91_05275, partial [Candidatus Omnitrophica bacterium]|nr:hypothetical protein [Candidatus Omnitrophota bacterium]
INGERFKDRKVMSAALYLYTKNVERSKDSKNLIIEVFALIGDWGEGNQDRKIASEHEVSWNQRGVDGQRWVIPGIGKHDVEYNSTVLGGNGLGLGDVPDDWVAIGFNKEGLRKLERYLNGKEKFYGFLLKAKNGAKGKTLTYFFSSEAQEAEYRPFFQMGYVPAPKTEASSVAIPVPRH